MARATVRYSINGESSNVTGNAVRQALEGAGFVRIGTGAFEADGPSRAALLATLGTVFPILQDPPGGGTLDHVWVHV